MKNEKTELDSLKILVCCHKPSDIPDYDFFVPVQGGAILSEHHWGIQRDDMLNEMGCENISSKNKNYCELTVLYWAWKNIRKLYPNIKYIGLNHYRRYFSTNFAITSTVEESLETIKDYSIDLKKVLAKLNKNRIILPKPISFSTSLAQNYSLRHVGNDYLILKNVYSQRYPDEVRTFNKVFEKNNKLSPFNMFIMSIDEFENYCSWLFAILGDVENYIDVSSYDEYQKRVYGFMAERLFNLYCYNKKTMKIPVKFYVEEHSSKKLDKLPKKIKGLVENILTLLRTLKADVCFLINKKVV